MFQKIGRGSWKPNLRPMEPDFWDSKYDKDYYDWDQADENMMEKYKNSKLGKILMSQLTKTDSSF